jgi:hypothetical protein
MIKEGKNEVDGVQNKRGEKKQTYTEITGGMQRKDFINNNNNNIILIFSINFSVRLFAVEYYSSVVNLYNYHQFVQLND